MKHKTCSTAFFVFQNPTRIKVVLGDQIVMSSVATFSLADWLFWLCNRGLCLEMSE